MTASLVSMLQSFQPGFREIDGGDCLALANIAAGAQSGITALAGGASAAASPIVQGGLVNDVTTVATTNDSVALPLAIPGDMVTIINSGANTLKVYAQTQNPNNPTGAAPQGAADLIKGFQSNATEASNTIPSGYVNTYICATLGIWKSVLMA